MSSMLRRSGFFGQEEECVDIFINPDVTSGVTSILKKRSDTTPYPTFERSARSLKEEKEGRPHRSVSFKLPTSHKEKASGRFLRKKKPGPSAQTLLALYLDSCTSSKTPPIGAIVTELTNATNEDRSPASSLNLSELKNLSVQELKCMCDLISNHSTLRAIDLKGLDITDEHMAVLVPTLAYRASCEQIVVADNPKLTSSSINLLGQLMAKTICLSYLNLSGIQLDFRAVDTLKHFMPKSRLRALILHSCGLKNLNNLRTLVTACKRCVTLSSLSLKDNHLSYKAGPILADLLIADNIQHCLDLRSNNLSDQGVIDLMSGLLQQTCLRRLILFDNNIKDKGAKAVCQTFIQLQDQSPDTLDMSCNPIGSAESIRYFKDVLCSRTSLNTLYLYNVGMHDDGIISLAEGVAESRTLRRLELRKNYTGIAGLMALNLCLKNNPHIFKVMIDIPSGTKEKHDEELAQSLVQSIQRKCGENLHYLQESTADGYDAKRPTVLQEQDFTNKLVDSEERVDTNDVDIDNTVDQDNDIDNTVEEPSQDTDVDDTVEEHQPCQDSDHE